MTSAAVALLFSAVLAPILPNNASAQVFHEDFDGNSVNLDRWDLSSFGSAVVSDGWLHLAPNGCRYPYLTTRQNPFPTNGDFLCRVGFRFVTVQRGGNGFGSNDIAAGNFASGFALWQDNSSLGLRTGFGEIGYPFLNLSAGAPDTAYHVFEWRYEEGLYTFYLDGLFVDSSRSSRRPDQLFIGHPEYCFSEPWSTSQFDFIHLEWLNQPVPVHGRTWGAIKGQYRE